MICVGALAASPSKQAVGGRFWREDLAGYLYRRFRTSATTCERQTTYHVNDSLRPNNVDLKFGHVDHLRHLLQLLQSFHKELDALALLEPREEGDPPDLQQRDQLDARS